MNTEFTKFVQTIYLKFGGGASEPKQIWPLWVTEWLIKNNFEQNGSQILS